MINGCFDHSAIWSRTKSWRRNGSSVVRANGTREGLRDVEDTGFPFRRSARSLSIRVGGSESARFALDHPGTIRARQFVLILTRPLQDGKYGFQIRAEQPRTPRRVELHDCPPAVLDQPH